MNTQDLIIKEIGSKTQIVMSSVSFGSVAQILPIVSNNPNRIGLILSNTPGNLLTFGFTPTDASANGLSSVGYIPVYLDYRTHGNLVTQGLYGYNINANILTVYITEIILL